MKRSFLLLIFAILSGYVYPEGVYQNFIQIYGEGPYGRHPVKFDAKIYTKTDAILYAKREIFEFLSGMIYGYNFTYKVENKINKTKGFFDITPIGRINEKDPNLTLSQVEESQISLRIQAEYRLSDSQKKYMSGFKSVLSKMGGGESSESWANDWSARLDVYKDALENTILNGAKKTIKSRPLYVKGKILLEDSPKFFIKSGEWRCIVKAHLMILNASYIDSY
ncbi:MAG TPA: hypothetical protein PLG34_09135 [Spirochaetota bacterium]|jgi:hypothetical protein|nr:MAG: hypothetical protein BWX91_01784 [Spirochaetes bacterium ADurb.Bin133]HNZ26520.1 hypothetical protein [Spirochaetota bacterium]HPY88132.1 hypothetical protein [Spirochaetota bacterium]HQB60526.1 hypothetical protein [Spirochaetota bacterium]